MPISKSSRATVVNTDPNSRFVYVMESDNPEDVMADRVRDFLNTLGFSNIFPYFSGVRIGTVHPFATLLAQEVIGTGETKASNLFPSITVTESSENNQETTLSYEEQDIGFTEADIARIEGYRDANKVFCSDAGWARIKTAIAQSGTLVGRHMTYYMTSQIEFNIWSENKEVTSFLYDSVCQFLVQDRGILRTKEGYDIQSFSGRRSGDINLDYGRLLYGANVSVGALLRRSSTRFDVEIGIIGSVDTQTLPEYQ